MRCVSLAQCQRLEVEKGTMTVVARWFEGFCKISVLADNIHLKCAYLLHWRQHNWEDEAETKIKLVGTTVAQFERTSYFTSELTAK